MFSIMITSVAYSYGEDSSSLQIEVKYTNGDRIDAYQTNFVIYQDSDKNPFLEKKLEANPETVTLPKDHRYKVEVYVNGMFSEVGYIELKNSLEKLEVNIPLPGGLKFNVFFEDGETPIDGATVIIKSHDGQEQKVGKTDDLGQTMRYWLQSTNLKDDFYVVEVYFDEFLLTTVSNIKVHQGIAQEQKIIVHPGRSHNRPGLLHHCNGIYKRPEKRLCLRRNDRRSNRGRTDTCHRGDTP